MKKRISLIFGILAIVLCFAGCGSNKNAKLQYDEASIEQVSDFLIDYCVNADEATIKQWNSMTDFQLEQQLTDAGLPFTPKSFLGALESFEAGVKECGAYIGHGDYTYDSTAKELNVTTDAEFENRDATITFQFDRELYLKSMTVSGEFSTGEILKKAGLNTVLGMGTVFVVLIFISLIISLFRFIPSIQNAFTRKQDAAVRTNAENESAVARKMEEPEASAGDAVSGDAELIAVISAAVAAAEGTGTDGFVVRSIRRRPSNKWNS